MKNTNKPATLDSPPDPNFTPEYTSFTVLNKNGNIYKREAQEIRWSDIYGLAANITEYQIISKLIFLRICIPNVIMNRQLFHVKNVCKNVKNQHVWNGCKKCLITITVLLHFLHFIKLYQESWYRILFW